ncbi:TIGR02679 family protein [Agromyces protaetiae]|uniref:TIGR02679 family protein n=1 Tax=Agromyces protaetiae TaxID=2509455 RepID=UPI0013ED798A|nr:TIGR02679 family protein [Agromyces protaetiae]
MSGNIERLRAVLGAPDLAWLVARLRTRLERDGELIGELTSSKVDVAERAAVARLLGRPVRAGASVSVPLDALDAVLRRRLWPDGLESAVVALTGPYLHPGERRRTKDAWRNAQERLEGIATAHPEASAWVARATRTGALKRNSSDALDAAILAARLAALADAVPVEPDSLAVLAGRLFADAHALDADRPLGRLAVGLVAALGALGPTDATGAHLRRAAWACVGVVVDELSSSVLTVGLPGGSGSPTARALAALSVEGQPALLTYRQVAGDDIGTVPRLVYVCENPAIVAAAADRLGASAPPLVCLDGQPGAAAVRLLRRLVNGGAALAYHGDFDGGGAAIARTLARHVPWQPWRFEAADYLAAVGSITGLTSFTGAIGATEWDPALAESLESHRLRVEEEALVETLLADLAAFAAVEAPTAP